VSGRLTVALFAVAFVAMLAQKIGPGKDKTRPLPFAGPRDVLRRWIKEWFFVLPISALSGRWLMQFRRRT
jgi:hypothetical protein